jgi:peptidoglycan/LPS O-acetylase OafA/YrhL
MTTPSEQSAKTGSFPLFDWLRFALASMVALSHEGLIAWGNAGNFAVQVFFALSGWLIGGILLRTKLHDLPTFYYNRGTRIWIPYAFAVAAIYLLSAARDPLTTDYFKFLFYDSTFTHNWFIPKIPDVIDKMPLRGTGSHFWSISVEEQFYLAAPLLIVLLPFGR